MSTININQSAQDEDAREQARLLGFHNASADIADVRTYVDEYTKISKVDNWERMNMSTAQGGDLADLGYATSNIFDGRYIYFLPYSADTILRFDTTSQFTVAGSWEQMSLSTAIGSMVDAATLGGVFDGRYVYLTAYWADTFARFDTRGTSFTTAADWETMDMSTAQGAAVLDGGYFEAGFDGRYVYFMPFNSDTFLRFDTQGTSFATVGDWQRMNMSTAQGANTINAAYKGSPTFDGQYIYFTPYNSNTFLSFDTQGTSFTTAGDWSQMSLSTALGAADLDNPLGPTIFDGRYMYFGPYDSDTFVRYDTKGVSFTTAASWEQMSMSTALGANVNAAFGGTSFDGRYVYYSVGTADTFIRFDTQGTSFTTTSDWQKMSVSTALGTATVANAFAGCSYDGKYIYFTAFSSDTFLRVLATPSEL